MTTHTLGGTSTAADSFHADFYFSDGITPFTMANAINNGKFHKKARRHRRPFFVDVRLARGPEELYEREAEFPVTIIAKRTAASRRQYLDIDLFVEQHRRRLVPVLRIPQA